MFVKLAAAVLATAVLTALVMDWSFESDAADFELSSPLKEWRGKGQLVEVNGLQMFLIDINKNAHEPAIILFHGFPSSSYEYSRALPFLLEKLKHRRLVLFDHVGFGFSDKPKVDYDYTLHDHAENALKLMQILNIEAAHIVAHDMGDSVLTEILSRRHLGLLPDSFRSFFKSVVFTNGGMRYDLINQRLSQRLLTLPYIGPFLARLNTKIPESLARKIHRQQLSSISGPETNPVHFEQDLEALFFLMRYQGGSRLIHKTVSYLNDRKRFESRWYRALKQLDIPCLVFWGDADSVAPMDIPKFLATSVLPSDVLTGKSLKDTGHFLMLEKPREWSLVVSDYILKHT